MSADHDQFDGWSASYVLSALEPSEKALFEAHLAECSICQEEVQDFAPLPGMLAQIDIDDTVDEHDRTSSTVVAIDQARRELAALELRERRWRRTAIAAIAAASILLAGIGVSALVGQDEGGSFGEVAFVSDADGEVLVDDEPWGMRIALDLEGLEARPEYELWTVDDLGNWGSVVAWESPPGGFARITGDTLLSREEVDRLVITGVNDRSDVVLTADL